MTTTTNTTKKTDHRTVTLNTPWVQGEQTITELVIRKPMGADLHGVRLPDFIMGDAAAYEKVLPAIVVNVALHPDTVSEQLDFIDLLAIQVEVAGFLPDAQASSASKTSTPTSP